MKQPSSPGRSPSTIGTIGWWIVAMATTTVLAVGGSLFGEEARSGAKTRMTTRARPLRPLVAGRAGQPTMTISLLGRDRTPA